MTPVQKEALEQIADQLCDAINRTREIADTLVRSSDAPEREDMIRGMRLLRSARVQVENILRIGGGHTPTNECSTYLGDLVRLGETLEGAPRCFCSTVELETPDYTPHERKTCQACAHGCCAMTSDVA